MKLTTMINDLHRFSLRKRMPINTLICKTMEIAVVVVAYVAVNSKNSFQCRDDLLEAFRGAVNDYIGGFGDEKK